MLFVLLVHFLVFPLKEAGIDEILGIDLVIFLSRGIAISVAATSRRFSDLKQEH